MILTTYDATAQHYGTWLSGYQWEIYGCGTFRQPVNEGYAAILAKRFFERLGRKLKAPVGFVAAMERRHSGFGDSPIPLHWHFLAAEVSPLKGSTSREFIFKMAEELWGRLIGNAEIKPYSPEKSAAYYVTKLVSHREQRTAVRQP